MRERFNFVGQDMSQRDEVLATEKLKRIRENEKRFIGYEQKKTEQELAVIQLFDGLLKSEFAELGIDGIPELQPNRFRIMSDAWFEKNMGVFSEANYYATGDSAVFNRSRSRTPLSLYQSFLHEGIHAASHQKHWITEDEIRSYRVGYKTANLSTEQGVHEHFRGLNEGIVEETTREMFWKHRGSIQQSTGSSADDLRAMTFSYEIPRMVVDCICTALADAQDLEKEEVWKEMKRGQFTGEMMHLREVELAYDMGALRVLDALEVSIDGEGEQAQVELRRVTVKNNKILEYFRSYGENKSEKRRQLAQEILGPADYKKYCT